MPKWEQNDEKKWGEIFAGINCLHNELATTMQTLYNKVPKLYYFNECNKIYDRIVNLNASLLFRAHKEGHLEFNMSDCKFNELVEFDPKLPYEPTSRLPSGETPKPTLE